MRVQNINTKIKQSEGIPFNARLPIKSSSRFLPKKLPDQKFSAPNPFKQGHEPDTFESLSEGMQVPPQEGTSQNLVEGGSRADENMHDGVYDGLDPNLCG